MSFLRNVRNWFKRPDPEAGSRWQLKYSSPFETDAVIEIIAVKQGWVQYGYVKFPHWKPSSMQLSLLHFIYKQL